MLRMLLPVSLVSHLAFAAATPTPAPTPASTPAPGAATASAPGPAATPKKPTSTAELVAISKPSDWRKPEQKNLLYFEIAQGKVIIELSPEYAPKHVERIRALAKEKYWDGLAITRSQDNYVVQWGDPNAEKPRLVKKAKAVTGKLPPELEIDTPKKIAFRELPDRDVYTDFVGMTNGMAAGRDKEQKKTWLLHCYGVLGVGRGMETDSGDGTELYVVIGHAPRHLDRNVAIVGRVLQGMEHLASLPRGHGPLGFYDTEKGEKPVTIKSIHLGSELPSEERLNLEVLRTDTELFSQLIEVRRTLPNAWFVFKTGHADACNYAVPVREVK
ncbi:MAG: peptidylprolyl isomerase [Bdellovibrionota bacterium]